MKCPNHPSKKLTEADFYWQKNGRLAYKVCKKCVIKAIQDKRKEVNDFYKMFAV